MFGDEASFRKVVGLFGFSVCIYVFIELSPTIFKNSVTYYKPSSFSAKSTLNQMESTS